MRSLDSTDGFGSSGGATTRLAFRPSEYTAGKTGAKAWSEQVAEQR